MLGHRDAARVADCETGLRKRRSVDQFAVAVAVAADTDVIDPIGQPSPRFRAAVSPFSRLPVALDGEVEMMHPPLQYRSRRGALLVIVP